jgi:hypothetical protein
MITFTKELSSFGYLICMQETLALRCKRRLSIPSQARRVAANFLLNLISMLLSMCRRRSCSPLRIVGGHTHQERATPAQTLKDDGITLLED